MKKMLYGLIIFMSFINISNASVKGRVYCPDDSKPVNFRPSISGNVTYDTGLACDSEVEVLNDNAGSNSSLGCSKPFYQVRQGIRTGYACGDFIKITDSPTTNEEGKVLCIEDTSPLGLYTDLTRTTKVIEGGLSCGTKVIILDRNAGPDGKGTCPTSLYKIRVGNNEGYVCGKYIGSANSSTPADIGKSTSGDNIYIKENYQNNDGNGTIKCYEDTGDLSLRSTPGGSSTGVRVSCGQPVKINSTSESSGICPYYYNVTDSNGNSGYVCSYYVNTTDLSSTALEYYKSNSLEDYYNLLREKKFPESYLPYLAELHARHPNWTFNAEVLPLTFDEVIKGENAFGLNLLQGSAFDENYYSMGLNSYDILNDIFSDYRTENGWYDASSEALAYYLDPRNYLNIKYILAFEDLGYNNAHTEQAVSKILKKTSFWNTVYANRDSNVAKDIVTSTSDIGISAFHIAARIEQEISSISTSDPRAGGSFELDGTPYSNYYNFFNIAVYGDNKILRGMRHAVDNGWDTPYKGIYGGGKFIYDGYYFINQDTLYYEKFDVSTSDGNYTHQYMQNLAVIAQETNKAYISYVENIPDYFDKDLAFTIPVYADMPNYAITSPRIGNPNNYLSDLKVDGNTINGFSYDKYEYEVVVPYNREKLNIDATKINSGASITGTGDVLINGDEVITNVIVKAASGNIRTYQIKIIKNKNISADEEIPSIETILNSSGIKYNDNYIYGIDENTSISSLISNVTNVSEYASISVKDSTGNNKTSGTFVTGDVVTIGNIKESKSLSIVIYGDVNADGRIDKDDCLAILRYLKGYADLTGVYGSAADGNHDGKIDKDDCLAILRHLKGYTNLNK